MKNIILLLSASLLLTQIFAQKFKADNFIGTQDIKQLVIRNDTLFILTNGGLVLMRNDGTHIRTISAKEGLNTRGYENLRFQEDGKLHAYYKFLSTVKEFEIDIAQDYKVKNISTTSKMTYESQHSTFRYTSNEEQNSKDKQYKTTLNCEFSNGTTKEYFIYTTENPYFHFKEDKNGRLWAWDFDSLYYFEGDKMITLKDQKKLGINAFLKSKDGTDYLLSSDGIYKVSKDCSKLTKLDLSKYLKKERHSLGLGYQSKNGDLWVYDNYEDILLQESAGQWDSTHLPSASAIDQTITCIAEDEVGNIWLGSSKGFIYQYNPTLKQWNSFPIHNPYPFNSDLEDILIDRQGNLLASGGNGIFQIDLKDNCKALVPDEKIKMEGFSTIVEDAKGDLWITKTGYYNKGVLKYSNGEWREFLRDKQFTALLSNPANGGIYLLDKDNTLFSIDSSGQTIVEKLNLIKDNDNLSSQTRALYSNHLGVDGKGRFWVYEKEGSLFNWSKDSIRNFTEVGETRFYRAGKKPLLKVRTTKDGALWVLSPKGLWKWQEEEWTLFESGIFKEKKGLNVYYMVFNIDANGRLWLLNSDKKRYYQFDGSKWTSSKIKINKYTNDLFFIDSKGRMWIEERYANEINCFEGNKNIFKCTVSSPIREFVEDKKGRIWARTETDGIYRFEEKNK